MRSILANKIKGRKKRLFKHFIATVYVDNGLKGEQFGFSTDDAERMRLPKLFSRTWRYLGENYYHNGLIITPIEEGQFGLVPYGVSEDYLALLYRNKNFVNPRIDPILGTVIFGTYKGLVFSLFGTKEIDESFSRTSIQRVMRGERKFHRSCDFRHVSHREAIPHHGKLTKEVVEDLLIHKCLKSVERHNE